MAGDTLANYNSSCEEKRQKVRRKRAGNTFVWDTLGKGAEN